MDCFHIASRRGNVLHDGSPNIASTYGASIVPTWTWDELAAATARHGMPWIAKGILTVEAAEAAMAAGASAILVYNHGGRQVDPSPASLDVLPEIAAAVSGQVPVLLDSGVRRTIELLTQELHVLMTLAGIPDIASLTRDAVARR